MGTNAFFTSYYEPNTQQADEASNFGGYGYHKPGTIVAPNCPCKEVGAGNLDLYDGSRFSARSNHTGGVNAALGDGSVHFVTNSVGRKVWRALGDTANGEAAALP